MSKKRMILVMAMMVGLGGVYDDARAYSGMAVCFRMACAQCKGWLDAMTKIEAQLDDPKISADTKAALKEEQKTTLEKYKNAQCDDRLGFKPASADTGILSE